jgi:hypothetical protein
VPVFTAGSTTIPAASIWTGSRLWCAAFRDHGLVPGDVIGIVGVPGPAMVQVIVAALWEDLCIAVLPQLSPELLAESSLPSFPAVIVQCPSSEDIAINECMVDVPTLVAAGIGGPAPYVSRALTRHRSECLAERSDAVAERFLFENVKGDLDWLDDYAVRERLAATMTETRYSAQVILATRDWTDPLACIDECVTPIIGRADHVVFANPVSPPLELIGPTA